MTLPTLFRKLICSKELVTGGNYTLQDLGTVALPKAISVTRQKNIFNIWPFGTLNIYPIGQKLGKSC